MILVNESLTLMYLYLIIELTDVMPGNEEDDEETVGQTTRQDITSWILLGIIGLHFAINLLKTLLNVLFSCYKSRIKRLNRLKRAKKVKR